jgi:molybdate transport system regulatory protein
MSDPEPDHPSSLEAAECRLRIRLVFDDGAMLGPGKADLLELIRETGSIAAAARRMGMSYKRAWLLVETLNASFRETLVESARGGRGHGGARLTGKGRRCWPPTGRWNGAPGKRRRRRSRRCARSGQVMRPAETRTRSEPFRRI